MIDENNIGHIGKPYMIDGEECRILKPMPHKLVLPDGNKKYKGLFVDVETTGKFIKIDKSKDDVTCLAYIKFTFDDFPNDTVKITSISEQKIIYNQPEFEIPQDIVELTGITNEMVAGKKIKKSDLEEMVKDVEVIISHNAFFDRIYIDRLFEKNDMPQSYAWGCTLKDLALKEKYKLPSSTLPVVLGSLYDWYFQHHTALEDCFAGMHILNYKDNFNTLINKIYEQTFNIEAYISYSEKDLLKARGYFWNSVNKNWFLANLKEEKCKQEEEYLNSLNIKYQKSVIDNKERWK